MINYFNFKRFDDEYLITNDAGKYAFIDKDTLFLLIKDSIGNEHPKYAELKEKLFIYDEHTNIFAQKASEDVAGNKNYLMSSTGLFIFVVTKKCNMNCIYCQAKACNYNENVTMTKEIAKKGVDIALSSPNKNITIEFQGGEPLLNFDVIKYIIEYSQSNKNDKDIEYCIATNLVLLTDDILEYFIRYNVNISTSLDGNKKVHIYNRRCTESSFDILKEKIEKIREKNTSLSAIQTTTHYSLNYAKEIIDEYVKLGFNSVFIRPLTRLGTAAEKWDEIGYTSKEFLDFYKECFEYIIVLNKRGVDIREMHTSILLKKILKGYSDNYMELRSPCGAGIGQMAIYYDGNIYTCDEGRMLSEMGDKSFLLGNVFDNTYDDLIDSPICKAVCSASVLEAQLGCCDCVYQPYCGICPVINKADSNDIIAKSPKYFRCKLYGGILDLIFKVLKSGDEETINILHKW